MAESAEASVVALEDVGSRVWERPVEVGAYPPAGPTALFVVEQHGMVWAIDGGEPSPILDISGRVLSGNSEEGLLSMALDPGFAENGHVWLYYSASDPRRAVLSRFTRTPDGPEIDPASELVILEVGQPFANHNGGSVRFGPDGMLYLGFGDGGSGGDPHGNGQDLGTLLGSVIRIDVRRAWVGEPYAIPADNPFVDTPGARGEIWAYGVRNPWRMSFDPVTGRLWAGDVGQNAVEEVDVIQRGENYGWAVMEGDRCYGAQTCDEQGLTLPVAVYGRAGGHCSVTGGVVYRGTAVPEVAGNYLYGDLCSGDIWALRADEPGEHIPVLEGVTQLTGFGIDAEGEVYVVAFGEPVRRMVSP